MNLFSISAHQPFLTVLCQQLLSGKIIAGFDFHDPMVLAGTRIYLPTERARRALGKELASQLGGVALLPQIRTFGSIDEVETQLLGVGSYEASPAISPLRRQLVLSQLVHSWAKDSIGHSSLSDAADLAGALAHLMDRFETEQVSMSGLAHLVPDEYQKNWQMILQFLEIIEAQWPAFLAEQGLINPAQQRNQLMASETEFLARGNFSGPIIAAGSTGSIPATAHLLKTIAKLPNGAVILPGFDAGLIAPDWKAILAEEFAEPSHPQFGLGFLLEQLEATPKDVIALGAPARTRAPEIISIAFAPASQTDQWAKRADSFSPDEIGQAFEKVSIIEAATEEEEARTIALIMREASQSDEITALVTPQRTLARRVASELQRWGIDVEDTAGSPLREASATRYLRLLIEAGAREFAPIELLAFLRNRLTGLGLSRLKVLEATLLLEEKVLRGPRPSAGVAGLRQALALYREEKSDRADTEENCAKINSLLDALETVFAPLTASENSENGLATWANILIATLEAATRYPGENNESATSWNAQLEGAPELLSFLQALASESPSGISLNIADLRPLIETLIGTRAVHLVAPSRPNLFIWGPLEARLQYLDRVILAGLSETVWPQAVDTGPWLSRHMQAQLGLQLPERFIGLAAHDIEMALGLVDRSGKVFLTRAKVVDGSPKTTSRWLQRLTTFIGKDEANQLKKRGEHWLALSADLDRVDKIIPATRPAPCPRVNQRPRGLSVTDAEILFRDPYAFYAKHTLKLRTLEPIGGEPDHRERGQIMHKILERFIKDGYLTKYAPDSDQALRALLELAEEELHRLDAFPSLKALWRKRFSPIATRYLEWEAERTSLIARRFAEVTGKLTFTVAGEPIELRGRADRLDLRNSGMIDIIDFKTGTPPTSSDVRDLWSPQLPLEGMMIANGGFETIAANQDVSFNYIKISHGPEPFSVTEIDLKDESSSDLIERVHQQLARQIEALLLRDDLAFVSRIAPRTNQNFKGDFDHLARVDEWSQMTGEGDI